MSAFWFRRPRFWFRRPRPTPGSRVRSPGALFQSPLGAPRLTPCSVLSPEDDRNKAPDERTRESGGENRLLPEAHLRDDERCWFLTDRPTSPTCETSTRRFRRRAITPRGGNAGRPGPRPPSRCGGSPKRPSRSGAEQRYAACRRGQGEVGFSMFKRPKYRKIVIWIIENCSWKSRTQVRLRGDAEKLVYLLDAVIEDRVNVSTHRQPVRDLAKNA